MLSYQLFSVNLLISPLTVTATLGHAARLEWHVTRPPALLLLSSPCIDVHFWRGCSRRKCGVTFGNHNCSVNVALSRLIFHFQANFLDHDVVFTGLLSRFYKVFVDTFSRGSYDVVVHNNMFVHANSRT